MKKLITAICTWLLFGSVLSGQDGERMVSVGEVEFLLADAYVITARRTISDGEACLIRMQNASDADNYLLLEIHQDVLRGIDGLTSEEVGDMLSRAVDRQAGVFADEKRSGYSRVGSYDIHYEDNADGKYFPHCYSFLKLRDSSRKLIHTYTQATLVSGKLISGCAVASDEGELAAFMDIISAVTTGAFL